VAQNCRFNVVNFGVKSTILLFVGRRPFGACAVKQVLLISLHSGCHRAEWRRRLVPFCLPIIFRFTTPPGALLLIERSMASSERTWEAAGIRLHVRSLNHTFLTLEVALRSAFMIFLSAFVLALAVTAHAQEPQMIGSFAYVHSLDPMTDADRSTIMNLGEDTSSRSLSLGWRCMSDGLNILVLTGHMGGDRSDRVVVQYRLDSSPASESQRWQQSSNSQAAFAPMNQVSQLTQAMMNSKKVVVRVSDPLDGETKTNTFSLSGLSEALRKLPCASDLVRTRGGV
jgi:hypothetical protein